MDLTLPPGDRKIGGMADGLLPIGAFSRASFLSVKSLRAYHEAGILVPARVDPSTGYRTYHASQLIDAAVIARLRSLDLPLDKVREVVQARDPEVTARVLADHEKTMRSASPTSSGSCRNCTRASSSRRRTRPFMFATSLTPTRWRSAAE